MADKGTLFLDEVGDIPLELQPKLLRVLQEQEFERLGSTRTRRVDVRVVAATNRDLSRMVENGAFRNDLFYRLNVFPVSVPPLRERREDIPMLVRYFAQNYARRMNRHIETVSAETLAALERYHWPGNVRELENLIERAVILSPGPVLHVPLTELKSIRMAVRPVCQRSPKPNGTHPSRARRIEVGSRRAQGAAALLGMKRTTLAVPHAEAGHRPSALKFGELLMEVLSPRGLTR